MMNFFFEKKITRVFIITLVLINLILLCTFWYKNFRKTEKDNEGENLLRTSNRSKKNNHNFRPQFRVFLKEQFGFNEEQIKRFRTLRDKHFIDAEKFRSEIENTRKKMMELLLGNTPDNNLVNKLASEIGAKITEHEKLVFLHFQDLLKISNQSDNEQSEEYKYFILGMLDKNKHRRDKPHGEERKPPRQGNNFLGNNDRKRNMPPPGMDDFEIKNRIEHLIRKLNLTDDQISKIKKIFEETSDLIKSLQKGENRLPPQEHHRLMQDLDQKTKNILTEEQKKIFMKLISERRRPER